MRFCSIVLALVLAGAGVASAQGTAAVGVKGGLNFADLKFEAEGMEAGLDTRTGPVGGLFVVFPANGRLALQTEALFSQKGAEISEGGNSGRIRINYLEVPVLARVSSTPAGDAAFHVFGGPSFAFRLSAEGESTFDGEESSEDLDDEIEGFDLGLVVGAGVEIGRVVVDGRYTWGLTNINAEASDAGTIKNRAFAVMVGFRF